MKKPVMMPRFSRRMINLVFVCLLCGGVLFAWQTVATLQTKDEAATVKHTEKADSVHSAKRGNPFVNFTDGADLASPNAAKNDNSQPKALASGDFDSDGVADLVTADSAGNLKFYRGVDLKTGEFENGKMKEIAPFELTNKVFTLNISPDYLFAGDFNADGKQDILATAKGANFLVLLGGDGRGNFSQANALQINGNITALTSGEIGRKDGQTDVAVAFSNKSGAFLAVFEHPEGAFKHKPEIFKLPAPANDLAIGNLDEDFFADIAAASGNILTIIHGRGQAYPWDLMPDSGIKRPAAFVGMRKMPFAISALTVGRFSTKRGETLALLGTDGNIYRLERDHTENTSKNKIPANLAQTAAQIPFVPTDAEVGNLAMLTAPEISPEEAENLGIQMIDRADTNEENRADSLKKKQEEAFEKYKNTDIKDRENMSAEAKLKSLEQRERAKAGFLRTISGKPSTLLNWTIETLAAGFQFANAAVSNSSQKMLRVNVSDSNLDDILLLDSTGRQIQIVSQVKDTESNTQTTTQIKTLETESNPAAILPLRLNMDALSDLVVLRQGTSVPSIVMTAPTANLTVTSTDDTGDCQPGNPCSLRNAILYSNSHSGVETITFNLNGATITPSAELPNITDAVNIYGSVGGNGQPSFEITGVNVPAPASGLAIRTSNSFIFGLAINSFKSVPINNGQSQLGGSGITIFSNSSSPNNGNNVILNNFLGTDRTGSLDKGNAVGLLIFDSDNNQIIQNVISGNGSQQISGIGIDVTAGNSNLIINNIVGLNSLGTGKVANTTGVFLTGLNNTFGGDGAGDGNTVSGNGEPYFDVPSKCGGNGLSIPVLVDLQTQELLTFGNTVSGNRLGTNPAGNQGLGNCYRGIETVPITGTFIGSITENGRNIISDNGYDAIWCGSPFSNDTSEFGFCAIVGNNIGTDISGIIPIRNDQRNIRDGANPVTAAVFVTGNGSLSNVGAAGGTTPNGACTGFCNLISGNDNSPSFNSDSAVEIGGLGTIGIFNNYIGTDKNGTQAISNYFGVAIASTTNSNFSPTYLLGGYGLQDGNTVSFGNLISGNSNGGVAMGVGGNTIGNYFVLGNKIGTDASGTFAVSNGGSNGFLGAAVNVNTGFGFGSTEIGDTNLLGRNIISGNVNDGINVFTGYNVSIANNLIGLNSSLAPLGNDGNGISMGGFFGVGNIVGGGQSAAANSIRNNGKAGILVKGSNYFSNNLRGNSISGNGGLGIDLNASGTFGDGDGVTPNDCQDTDSGANDLQNFPELLAPVQNGNGTLTLSGVLRSIPRQNYAIDFYSNSQPDPSGYGEGATYIGSVNAMTDGNGFSEFQFTSATPVSAGLSITATATDAYGNTSEFSQVAGASGFASLNELAESLPPTCGLQPIIVNTTSNLSDSNINDGLCDIDLNTPGEQCSLRAAIEEANHRPGFDIINFNILPRGSEQTISPLSPLPTITAAVDIDARTQAFEFSKPLIELRGDAAGLAYGFTVQGGSATIAGFTINHFQSIGIAINGGANHRVESCYIGTNIDGVTADTNARTPAGIVISGASNTHIGGTNGDVINVISNNLTGIGIVNSTGITVSLNKIGTDKTGTLAIPNDTGIALDNANRNEIGGSDSSYANLLSGNNNIGIALTNNSSNNKITGNLIGTKADGMSALANGLDGIFIATGANKNTIGGDLSAATRNIISGQNNSSGSAGIFINADAGINNQVLGNFIGVNQDASDKIPNRNGVVIFADKQIVGRGNSGYPNVISGNQDMGIFVAVQPNSSNFVVSGNKIENNSIGTNVNSSATNLGNGKFGIELLGFVDDTLIKENTIGNNTIVGVDVTFGTTRTQITSNRIGVNGIDEPLPNGFGVYIRAAKDNTVYKNTISGNNFVGVSLGTGFLGNGQIIGDDELTKFVQTRSYSPLKDGFSVLTDPDLVTSGNKIVDNKIGVNHSGDAAIPNGQMGLVVGENAFNNCIGGCENFPPKSGNTISGHTQNSPLGYGIFLGTLANNPDPLTLPHGNLFRDNIIGMSTDITQCLPNNVGMFILQAGANRIGETVLGNNHGNLINCNTFQGISVKDQTDGDLIIKDNFIGTVPHFGNFGNLVIGIEVTKERTIDRENAIRVIHNTIGNNGIGLKVGNLGNAPFNQRAANIVSLSSIEISGNSIGVQTDAGTTETIGNTTGVMLENTRNVTIGFNGVSGGTDKNIISGNMEKGVFITGEQSSGNVVNNSIIGTDENSDSGLGNGTGIQISNASRTMIGNPDSNYRNSIAGNNGDGVKIEGFNAANNVLHHNFIGIAPNSSGLRNFGNGVLITDGARLNEVGGTGADDGNTIAFSGGSGVRIDETAGHCNLVDPNAIFGNTGLGIDIGALGRTPNDLDDADSGANNQQNYPEIVSKQIVNNELIVNFKIDSLPGNSNYGANGLYVEFFKADNSGEGERFLGFTYYTVADHNGSLVGTKTVNLGNINTLGITANDPITASATDADNNTSEFFPPFAPTAASVTISGNVRTFEGNGISRVHVILTDHNGNSQSVLTSSFGKYRFENIEAGQFYTVAVSAHKYQFETPTQIFQLVEDRDDLDFIASP